MDVGVTPLMLFLTLLVVARKSLVDGTVLGTGHDGREVVVNGGYAYKSITLDVNTDDQNLLKRWNRFNNELGILADNEHPNIIKSYGVEYKLEDLESNVGTYSLKLELCDGDLLHRDLTFNEELLKELMRQMLTALDCLHKKQIYHRDIKLENILFKIEDNGQITFKLADFEVATHKQSSTIEYGSELYYTNQMIAYKRKRIEYNDLKDNLFNILIINKLKKELRYNTFDNKRRDLFALGKVLLYLISPFERNIKNAGSCLKSIQNCKETYYEDFIGILLDCEDNGSTAESLLLHKWLQ